MGKEFGGSPGGGGAIQQAVTEMTAPFRALMHGTNPNDDPATIDLFAKYPDLPTVIDHLVAIQAAGSPYTTARHYDPAPELSAVEERVTALVESIDELDPSNDLGSAFAIAATIYDTYVDPMTDNDRVQWGRAAVRVTAGMFDMRAVQGSQFHNALAAMEIDRRQQAKRERFNAVLTIAEAYTRRKDQTVNAKQLSVQVRAQLAQQRILAEQDKIAFDVDAAVRDLTWNMDRWGDAINMTTGAAGVSTPRPQSQRERMLGALNIAVSTGLNVGAATNPGIGAAAGLLNLAGSLWAQGGR